MSLSEEVKGLSPELVEKLKARGINSANALLDAGKTTSLRKTLAADMGIDAKQILEYINRADLARVKGIGFVYSDLLEEAGVDTVKELAARVPANLHAKMEEINGAKKVATRLPTPAMVEDWVAQAKALPKMVEY